jgi:Mn2+/Fe2+ NRAMP family transporter
MGGLVNRQVTTAVAIVCAVLILALNVGLIAQTLT